MLICDSWSTLYQHWSNVLCLLGRHTENWIIYNTHNFDLFRQSGSDLFNDKDSEKDDFSSDSDSEAENTKVKQVGGLSAVGRYMAINFCDR